MVRGAAYSYKIREVTYNQYGSVFAITIPRHIALLFSGIDLHLEISGSCIMLHSGSDCIPREEVKHERPEDKWYKGIYVER